MLLSCSTFELSSWFKGTILMDAFLELHCRRRLRQCRCQSQEPHTIVEFVELKWIEKSQQCLEASCSGLTQRQRWLKPAKSKFTWCNFTNVLKEIFKDLYIISVSGDWMHFICKICQIVAGISIISQFHEFSNLISGGILPFGPTVLPQLPAWLLY